MQVVSEARLIINVSLVTLFLFIMEKIAYSMLQDFCMVIRI